MKLISSSLSFYTINTRFALGFLFPFAIFLIGLMLKSLICIVIGAVISFFGYLFYKNLMHNVYKIAYLDKNAIILEGKGQILTINFSDIKFIQFEFYRRPHFVTIHTKTMDEKHFIPLHEGLNVIPEVKNLIEKFQFDDAY